MPPLSAHFFPLSPENRLVDKKRGRVWVLLIGLKCFLLPAPSSYGRDKCVWSGSALWRVRAQTQCYLSESARVCVINPPIKRIALPAYLAWRERGASNGAGVFGVTIGYLDICLVVALPQSTNTARLCEHVDNTNLPYFAISIGTYLRFPYHQTNYL